MKQDSKERGIFWLFEFFLAVKIFNSIWEIILGIIILVDKNLKETLFGLINHYIAARHHNIAPYLSHGIERISHSTEIYIAVYLIGQGIIKIFLVVGLLKEKLWIYPVSIYAFLAFVFYQVYRFNHTHAPLLIVFSIFDLITIWLIKHEYELLKKNSPADFSAGLF